jgi:hypothetical protein
MTRRRAAAVGVLTLAAGAVAEADMAGPFRPVAWWRAPLTGSLIMGVALALDWACRELSQAQVTA